LGATVPAPFGCGLANASTLKLFIFPRCVTMPNLFVLDHRYDRTYTRRSAENFGPFASRLSRSLKGNRNWHGSISYLLFLISDQNNYGPISYRHGTVSK